MNSGGNNVMYHTVTFNQGPHGLANPSDATRQVVDGQPVGALPATTHDNILLGWFTEPYGSGTYVTSSTVVTADVTFYAEYTSGGSND